MAWPDAPVPSALVTLAARSTVVGVDAKIRRMGSGPRALAKRTVDAGMGR